MELKNFRDFLMEEKEQLQERRKEKIINIKDVNDSELKDYIQNEFGENVDVWKVIQKLEENKDINAWIFRLFEDFKLTGIANGWHKNGKMAYESYYKKGKENGIAKEWYDNGQLKSEISFRNGKENGLCRGWHKNGKKFWEYNCEKGDIVGISKSWDEEGNLKYEYEYKNGNIIKKV